MSLPPSPPWSPTVKLLVGMASVIILAVVVYTARSMIGPLLVVLIVSYLLFPLTHFISERTRLSWQWSANLVFLAVVAGIAGLSTYAGVTIVQQVESLLALVRNLSTDIPGQVQRLLDTGLTIGDFYIDLSSYASLDSLTNDLIGLLQTVVSQAGSLVSTFAASAGKTIGWMLFILLISYFILVDAGKAARSSELQWPSDLEHDLKRISAELSRIWNSFLRGQLIIVGIVIIAYTIIFSILGVRYSFGLALLAGMARFVPYIGPLTTNVVTFLITFFQNPTPYGLESLAYAVLVVGLTILVDYIFDNMISPRIMGDTLGVHPAAVMISAIIGANLIGIVGLVLAAPVLATFLLCGKYIFRKILDMDPWPPPAPRTVQERNTFSQRLARLWRVWQRRLFKK